MKNTKSLFQKKLISILVLVAFVVCLTGCHLHSYSKATCTEPAICSVCGEEKGEPLGHTVQIGSCERCGDVVGADILNLYVLENILLMYDLEDLYSNFLLMGFIQNSDCDNIHNRLEFMLNEMDKYEEFKEVAEAARKLYDVTEKGNLLSFTDFNSAMNEYLDVEKKFMDSLPSELLEAVKELNRK